MRFLMLIALIISFTTCCFEGFAQGKITVSGVVKDKNGNPQPGTNIEAGKPRKVIGTSDAQGNFTVTVDAGTDLFFTHTGFTETRQRVIASQSKLLITITAKENSLQEVVVQGFRLKSRETSTGSSTVVSGKVLQDIPVSNVVELLQGKVAGLNIQNNTGSPGGMGTIQIRGLSSASVSSDGFLTPTSPLFVIDGVPVDVNTNFEYGFQGGGPGISPLALIPPEDIEQMDVLRDAAAISQYGARGVYGVIIVTTKRGRSKVPIVQYSSNVFVNTAPKLREVYGGKEERLTRIRTILQNDTSAASVSQAMINQQAFLSDSLNPYYNNSTDWQDYFFGTKINHQHNLSVYGGDQRFNYKTNLNYYNENGIIANTGFKRYTLSMNALYQPVDEFRMVVNLSSVLGQKQNGSGIGLIQTGLASNASASSLLPPPSLFTANNTALAAASIKNNNKTSAVSSSLDLQYEPVKGIRLGNLLSYNFNAGTSDIFKPAFLSNGSSEAYSYNDRTYTLYNRSTLSFIKTVADIHNFSGQFFNEINSYGFRANAIQLNQTAHDQLEGPIGYNWSASKGGTLNNIKDTRQHGYGASISYNLDKKYVLDFNMRFDGVSTNGPNQGYTRNPSVSARWNFSKEGFLKKATNSWLSYGSVRGSWGKNIRPTGNIFDVFGRYRIGSQFNNYPTIFADYGSAPNPDFLPETQSMSNIGMEIGMFDNKIEVTLESYYRSIDNQLIDVQLSNINGFTKLVTNAVSLVNYGVEWTAKYRVFKTTNSVQWTIGVTGGFNRDVLTKLPNGLREIRQDILDNGSNVPIVKRIGRNAISNLLYHTQGIYGSTDDVPVNMATGKRQQLGSSGSGFYFQGGDPRWTDINGDYVIDANDLLPIGNPQPLVTGGFNSNLSYKSFQLIVYGSYTLKRDLLNASLASQFQNYINPLSLNSLLPIENYKYWKATTGGKGTTNALYPNPFDFRRAGTLQPFRTNQTLFLEDGSYWKINSVILMYNVDRKFLSRLGMSSCKLTLTANNVYTFSRYSGPDPELVTGLGRDNSGGFPRSRSYAFGINVQF